MVHRLNHEDNGLMMLVNVIPEVSSYALSVPGAPGRDAVVRILDNGDKPVATVTPFPGFEGTLSTAMGDVDDDGVYERRRSRPSAAIRTTTRGRGRGAATIGVSLRRCYCPRLSFPEIRR